MDEVFNAINTARLADDLVARGLYPVCCIWRNGSELTVQILRLLVPRAQHEREP